MKITKELLAHLKVKSISIENDGKNSLCCLERIEKGTWTFKLPKAKNLEKGMVIEFTILFENEDEKSITYSVVENFGEDWICVIPEKNAVSFRLSAFYKVISDMEEKYESFGRRKEERVKIGKEKSREFGLSSLEQGIFLQGVKLLQPCVVLDASIHGICVITTETPFLRNEETFYINLSFVNPEQKVILKAHKVYSKVSRTEQKTFITLSCQLLEPIHFAWRERVIDMIQKHRES